MNRSFLTRLFCIAILTCGLVFSPLAAQADNSGWYVGVDAGRSRFTGINSSETPIVPEPFGSTDAGYRLSAGYSFDPFFAVEGGYVDLGKVSGGATDLGATPGGFTCGYLCSQSFVVNAELKTRGWILEAVGSYPFTDRWAVFMRAGGIRESSELSVVYTPIPPWNISLEPNSDDTSDDTDFIYGAGVRWSAASDWAVQLSWDRYTSLGHGLPVAGVSDFDVDLMSLGIVYQF